MDIGTFSENIDKLLDYVSKLEKDNLEYVLKIKDLKNTIRLKNIELDKTIIIN